MDVRQVAHIGRLEHEELKILGGLLIFSLLWIALAVPFVTSNPLFTSQNSVIQYFLFNFGFIIASIVVFGTIITMVLEKKYSYKDAFINGLSLWLSFSFILDIFMPPYAIDALGNEIITGNSTGINASTDKMFAFIFNSILPQLKSIVIPFLNVSFLYLAVYVFVPVLTAFIVALVLSKGNFIKWFNLGGVPNVK